MAMARTAWMRQGFELRAAALWSIVGKDRAEMAKYGIELESRAARLWKSRARAAVLATARLLVFPSRWV